HIWDTQFPAVTYLNGLFIFAAGVAILRKEHRWTRRWPVTVTILGWIATLGGFTRMFWPEAQQPAESAGLYAFLTAGFLAGGFLTYKAYGHRIKNETPMADGRVLPVAPPPQVRPFHPPPPLCQTGGR